MDDSAEGIIPDRASTFLMKEFDCMIDTAEQYLNPGNIVRFGY